MTKQDINVRQLAEMLDCGSASVWKWLAGTQSPSLTMMARIQTATNGKVTLESFVEDDFQLRAPTRRPIGRRRVTDHEIEEWLRSKGLRAVSAMLYEAPDIPFSKSVLQRYIKASRLPNWRVKVLDGSSKKPSRWVGPTALDVSDAYRILQSLRGRPDVAVCLSIEEVK